MEYLLVTNRETALLIDDWVSPQANEVGETADEFLALMSKSTAFFFPGKDRSRTRAIVTLLHGNEPSGLKVLHRWIKSAQQPCVNLLCIIGAVDVAKTEPRFTIRHRATERDLNRCFAPPYEDKPGKLAEAIITKLREYKPECLIDIHNTSGVGPAFSVTTSFDEAHTALALLFSHRLIYTDLRLGALMELGESDFPTVTIECGGRNDPEADEIAWIGFLKYVNEEQVLASTFSTNSLELFNRPVRLEVEEGTSIGFGWDKNEAVDVTIIGNLEHYNFDTLQVNERIAWVGQRGLKGLHAKNSQGENIIHQLFEDRGGELYPKRPLKLFMATTNEKIAKSDCLFYMVCDRGEVL